MTIEILYPELCQVYGDGGNARFLRACLPEAEFVLTSNRETPRFVTQRVDFLYLGSMSESAQRLAAERLLPFRKQLRERIEQGVVMLVTGNAIELFGQYIEDHEGVRTPMLGLYDYWAKCDIRHRHNSMFLGDFNEMPIIGYKSQFSALHGEFPQEFLTVRGGVGNDLQGKAEGFRDRNLFATYLLGPFLVLNPRFTKLLLRLMGADDALAFEKEVFEASDFRRMQFEKPGVDFMRVGHD